jgi:hypothetical protein
VYVRVLGDPRHTPRRNARTVRAVTVTIRGAQIVAHSVETGQDPGAGAVLSEEVLVTRTHTLRRHNGVKVKSIQRVCQVNGC